METNALSQLIITQLNDNKAIDVQDLDVTTLTDVTDQLIICSALSIRHINALKDKIVEAVKAQNVRPLSVDGSGESGWLLIDLGRIVVHIMMPETREFYSLEKLWTVTETARNHAGTKT